jgi:hypothetical protein
MDFNNLTSLLAEDDGGSGIYRLLPIIIITALYALSGLLKKKEHQKKQQKRPQPKPKSTRREETLPTYARRKSQQPARSQPRPVPTRRPAESKPEPIKIIPEPVARRPKPIPVPSAQRKHSPKAASHQATQQAYARDQAKAKRQMPKVVQPAEAKQAAPRTQATAKDAAAGKLNLALEKKSALVRAIVYAEILGKPIGLKSKGGYELE